jgi:hypothetical protein
MRPTSRRPPRLAALLVGCLSALPAITMAQQGAAPAPVAGTDRHASAPTLAAARRAGPVQVDGRLDDAAWQAATPYTSFIQMDPSEGQPASERTEARVLLDDDAIYIGVRMHDRNPAGIQPQLARRDESIEGDIVEITLDSYHSHLTGFLFRLSAAGARRDATVNADGGSDQTWDAVWEGRATVDAGGWSAEMRIPLSQLRYDARRESHEWGIQIARRIARKAEVSMLSFTPKNQRQGVHAYGHLTGIGRLASPRRIELVPYTLAKNVNPTVAPNDPFRRRNAVVPGMGMDAKYGITSNLTLDVTVNPDFGQVEVDPAVVNLSAFETFYPERRPFFVEGASIFQFGSMRTNNSSNGYNFVHTRRIGRTPQRSIEGTDIAFTDAPLETTIAAAAKLTGRSGSGWSIGLLDAVTTREEARFRMSDGTDGRAIVEPRANYFVGRVKRDLRQGNTTVGMGVTSVHRDLADPVLEPLFRSSAYAVGIDWNHAWGSRTWAFDGNVVATSNRGSAAAIRSLQLSPARYYQRPDRTGSLYDPTRTSLNGYVGELTLAKIAGRHWRGSLTYQDYSPGFETNEGGFLGSTDMRSISPLIQYSENTPNRYVRNWGQYLFWNPTWNHDGDMTFNGAGAITYAELPNFWNVQGRLDWRPQVFDDRLTRGGPVGIVPSGQGANVEISSDRRRRHTGGLFVSHFWRNVGGFTTQISPRMTIRPSTAVRVTLSPTYTRNKALQQYVTRVGDAAATSTYGSRYLFATLEQDQLSMVTRVDWTFTPALSLQLFAQPLIATADFVDYKELAQPRQFDFHVYGQDLGTIERSSGGDYTVDPDAAGPLSPFTFRDRDFNRRSLRGNAVLRWEYRPGSALFLVWQQQRFEQLGINDFSVRRDLDALLGVRPENVFVVKATWWVGR